IALAPASTPFLTTDQKGSLAWPCVTTAMLTEPPESAAAVVCLALLGPAPSSSVAARAVRIAASKAAVRDRDVMRFLPPRWMSVGGWAGRPRRPAPAGARA